MHQSVIGQEAILRNAVKVAFEVSIHDIDQSLLQEQVDPAQRLMGRCV
ncbi:MAG: hypothetical protein HC780_29965 [Leptolyngbyaceae cyanobacterium CSU_1_3]|nr:hypothetical protein [Leptolyngbyaceae cyanobacterium CSU_1_3]